MAMSLTGSGSRRGKNLTCGVCREVFRSPRLLPCFHTFCLNCLEVLAKAHGGRQFPCPQCRRFITVPPDGAQGFQINFYISEEELELERKGLSDTMCSTESHGLEPLVFFCLQCDSAICIRCKLTKHEGHDTEDLCKAAARCHSRLETSKKRLDDTISYLTERSGEARNSIKAAKEMGIAIKQKVRAKRDALRAKVDKWYDGVVRKVDKANDIMDKDLTAAAQKVQQEVDSLLQCSKRIHHTLVKASDAEKVCVEKEMREGQGSEKYLHSVKERMLVTTARAGLHYDHSSISEDDIRHLLGYPVSLFMPSIGAYVASMDLDNIYMLRGNLTPDYAAFQSLIVNLNRKEKILEKEQIAKSKSKTELESFHNNEM